MSGSLPSLPETSNFDASVYAIQAGDPCQGQTTGSGGSIGALNQGVQNLVNRTRWLYNQVSSLLAGLAGISSAMPTLSDCNSASLGFALAPSGCANAPNATDFFFISTVSQNGIAAATTGYSIMQVAYDISSAATGPFIRFLINGGGWGAWVVTGGVATIAATSIVAQLPAGIFMQCGQGTVPPSATTSSDVAVTFPKPFPNGIVGVYGNATGFANSLAGYAPSFVPLEQTRTGFLALLDTLSGGHADPITFNQPVNFNYIAFGN